jgi:hypothetical protein
MSLARLVDRVSGREVERSVRRSPAAATLVRCGLVGYGLIHLLVAWAALQVVLGHGSTSTKGALSRLADEPWGVVLLVGLAAGFGALTAWQAVAALVGYRQDHGLMRLLMRAGAVCRVATYAYLAVMVVRLLVGDSSGTHSPRATSAGVLAEPWGRVLLGVAGLVIVGTGVGLAVFGVRRGFVDQLDHEGRSGGRRLPIILLGQVGYVAKGAAFVLIGGLACWAAVSDDARRAGGLDQSLERLVRLPLGIVAVLAIGAGIGCFGLYLFARARHLAPRSLTS